MFGLVFLLTFGSKVTAECTSGGIVTKGENCYLVTPEEMLFADAESFCQENGMKIASMEDENNFSYFVEIARTCTFDTIFESLNSAPSMKRPKISLSLFYGCMRITQEYTRNL